MHSFKDTKSPQKPISDLFLLIHQKKVFDDVHKIFGLKNSDNSQNKVYTEIQKKMRKSNFQFKEQTILLKSI